MNETTPPTQPPAEPGETSGSTPGTTPGPPPYQQQQAYTPPPLPPGYEQHYRPIYHQALPPRPPSNNNATASIILGCGSLGLLFITAGILAPISLIASAVAIPLGHKGKEDVDHGKTTKDRDVAVAGMWTGIGGVILSVIAIIAWIVVIAVALNSDINWTDGNGDMHHFNLD